MRGGGDESNTSAARAAVLGRDDVTRCKLQVTSHKLQATSYKLQATSYSNVELATQRGIASTASGDGHTKPLIAETPAACAAA